MFDAKIDAKAWLALENRLIALGSGPHLSSGSDERRRL
jgi:hypothetical protein